ncbi:MAG: hypothetical protein [Malazfec virus 1]
MVTIIIGIFILGMIYEIQKDINTIKKLEQKRVSETKAIMDRYKELTEQYINDVNKI